MTRLTRKNCLYNYKFGRFEFNSWQHLMTTPVFRQPQQTLRSDEPSNIIIFIYNIYRSIFVLKACKISFKICVLLLSFLHREQISV